MKILLYCLISITTFCQEAIKVLFVGNSLIAYNNTPQLVQDLMESNKEPYEIFSFVHNGARLEDNLKHINAYGRIINSHTATAIEPEKWDIIILQQGSATYYIKNSFETTLKTIQLFNPTCQKSLSKHAEH